MLNKYYFCREASGLVVFVAHGSVSGGHQAPEERGAFIGVQKRMNDVGAVVRVRSTRHIPRNMRHTHLSCLKPLDVGK